MFDPKPRVPSLGAGGTAICPDPTLPGIGPVGWGDGGGAIEVVPTPLFAVGIDGRAYCCVGGLEILLPIISPTGIFFWLLFSELAILL